MKIERYTIRSIFEEAECERCGWLMFVGEPAYDLDETSIVCSRFCAIKLFESKLNAAPRREAWEEHTQ